MISNFFPSSKPQAFLSGNESKRDESKSSKSPPTSTNDFVNTGNNHAQSTDEGFSGSNSTDLFSLNHTDMRHDQEAESHDNDPFIKNPTESGAHSANVSLSVSSLEIPTTMDADFAADVRQGRSGFSMTAYDSDDQHSLSLPPMGISASADYEPRSERVSFADVEGPSSSNRAGLTYPTGTNFEAMSNRNAGDTESPTPMEQLTDAMVEPTQAMDVDSFGDVLISVPSFDDALNSREPQFNSTPASIRNQLLISADDSALEIDHQLRCRNSHPVKQRRASTPPQCVSHYSFLANWPPTEAPRCDLGHRVDVFPPKDAPLHVHVQAYALRWAVWSAEIKDPERRKQVIEAVAGKMREAWENAIGNDYYLRPNAPADDSDHRNDLEEKSKKGRKRAVSPSRQLAGFASEGKDALAITNGELATHNLTMDIINKRVMERDFDAGEQILDQVLDTLNRDHLVVKDWSKTIYGNARGRNLLMYCLYVVLESRKERKKLNKLLATFTKEVQKRNTRTRIDNYQEREFQHMALATELRLAELAKLESENGEGSSEDEDEKAASVSSQFLSNHEDGHDDTHQHMETPASAGGIAEINIGSPDDINLINDLAKDVLSAGGDTDLYTVFASRGLKLPAFVTRGSTKPGGSSQIWEAKKILGQIFEHITELVANMEIMKRLQEPSEKLKMGHDARLTREKISKAREILAKCLSLDAHGPKLGLHDQREDVFQDSTASMNASEPNSSFVRPNTRVQRDVHVRSSTPSLTHGPDMSHSFRSIASPLPQNSSISMPSSGQPTTPQISDPQQMHLLAQTIPHNQTMQPSQYGHAASSQMAQPDLNNPLIAKRVYIEEKWRPWINFEMQKRGYGSYQGDIVDWLQLKNIVTNLGFPPEARNALLRKFKSQYVEWCQSKGIVQQQPGKATSPALSTLSLSPAIQPAMTLPARPPNWPSPAEVRAFIPPQGIHSSQLLAGFKDRIGQHMSEFQQLVKSIAFIAPNYSIYLSPQHFEAARQGHVLQSPRFQDYGVQQVSGPDATQSLKRNRPMTDEQNRKVIKLKLPTLSKLYTLPPAQNETDFPEEYTSTEINSTQGFSFRHLPHSTLQQRQAIDDFIAEYITGTAKSRRKSYYGQYKTFKDPQDPNGPPIAHGFWDHKDKTRAEGSEWFFERKDVPAEWLYKLGFGNGNGSGNDNPDNNDQKIGEDSQDASQVQNQPIQPYRAVWDETQNRMVKIKLTNPISAPQGQHQGQRHGQGHNQLHTAAATAPSPHQQTYDTYPPGYSNIAAASNMLNDQHNQPQIQFQPQYISPAQLQLTKDQKQQVHVRGQGGQGYGQTARGCRRVSFADDIHHADHDQDTTFAIAAVAPDDDGRSSKKRGVKRGSAIISNDIGADGAGGGNNHIDKPIKRRKKVLDDSDEDYVPA